MTRDDGPTAIQVDVSNQQASHTIDEGLVAAAVRTVLAGEGITRATISVAIVDDPTIHELNRTYLNHDYPTDVLSFRLNEETADLDGELIVSAETAANQAEQYGWTMADELLLYLVHGTLHLVGYEDEDAASQSQMRNRERHFLKQFGREVHHAEPDGVDRQSHNADPGERPRTG